MMHPLFCFYPLLLLTHPSEVIKVRAKYDKDIFPETPKREYYWLRMGFFLCPTSEG